MMARDHTASVDADTTSLGAYGLRVDGLPGARQWMQRLAGTAPHVRLCVEVGTATESPSTYDRDAADLRLLSGGRLVARRGSEDVHLIVPSIPPDPDLLHPYLAPAAALRWRWAGREALHAGVFEGSDGAVLLLGGKEAGKSTTLAWLAGEGVTVLADDLAILEGNRVMSGPRSIDLRSTGPVSVRCGQRQRLTLPAAPASLPLAGVAVLEWGDRVEVSPLALTQLWEALMPQRMFPALGADPASLLDLVASPAYRFIRPRTRASVAETGRALMSTFGSTRATTRSVAG